MWEAACNSNVLDGSQSAKEILALFRISTVTSVDGAGVTINCDTTASISMLANQLSSSSPCVSAGSGSVEGGTIEDGAVEDGAVEEDAGQILKKEDHGGLIWKLRTIDGRTTILQGPWLQGTSLEPEVRKPLPCELPTITSARTPCWSCLRPLSLPHTTAEGGKIVVAATNHDPAPMPPPAVVAAEVRNGRGGLPRCSLASPGLHQRHTLLPSAAGFVTDGGAGRRGGEDGVYGHARSSLRPSGIITAKLCHGRRRGRKKGG
nr:hypothetical protein Iba_chr08eCG6400 [Ipomoea batatas]